MKTLRDIQNEKVILGRVGEIAGDRIRDAAIEWAKSLPIVMVVVCFKILKANNEDQKFRSLIKLIEDEA